MRAPAIDPEVDLYVVLGVSRAATSAEIRRAYRGLALQYHPDRAGAASAQTFARIAEAYRMLSDPTARTAYDAHLFGRAQASAASGGGASADGRHWTVSGVGWSASWQAAIPNLLARLSGPLEALVAAGVAKLDAEGLLELYLDAAEAARGGTALVAMVLPVVCPTCGGVASPRGVWCRRCDYAGRVTETVEVQVPIPRLAREGAIVTAKLRRPGVATQRVRLRVVG